MKFKKLYVLIVMFLLSFNVLGQEQPKVLPDFKFLKIDSTLFSKSDLKPNKKTIIIFFDATCGHCKESMSLFNERVEEFKNENVILISLDVPKAINMFLDEFGKDIRKLANTVVLTDTNYEFIPTFSPLKYPSIYLYSEKNELLAYANNNKKIDDIFDLIANH